METRANYVTIGLFVLAVLAGAFLFVYWLYAAREGGQRTPIEIVFPGSVTGLAVGAPVYFNGIRIGEVGKLAFAGQGSTSVVATSNVDPNAPLKKDVRAELGFQGLTGIAYVSLTGGSQDQPSLFTDDARPVIQADRSAFEDLLEGARELMGKADKTLTTIEQVVSQNAPEVTKTIKNIEQFSDALAANSDAVRTLFADVGRAANVIADLSDRLQGIVGRAEEIIAEVKPGQVGTVVDNVVAFSNSLQNASKQVDAVMADIAAGSENLQKFLSGRDDSLRSVNRVIDAVPADAVKRIVESVDELTAGLAGQRETIAKFIDQATGAAGNINRISEALAARTDDIDATITNIRTFTDEIDQVTKSLGPIVADAGRILGAVSPPKVESIVQNIETVTSNLAARGGDIDKAIDDAAATAASARKFADDLAGHSGDVDAVATQARELMTTLNAASTRIAGILDKVDTLVDGDGQGFVAEATRAARAIRIIAEDFEPRANAIAVGLARFSTSGLTDLSAAISQARDTLMSIQNAVQGLERDPSRIIYGGSNQPTYKPQRR